MMKTADTDYDTDFEKADVLTKNCLFNPKKFPKTFLVNLTNLPQELNFYMMIGIGVVPIILTDTDYNRLF